jgi:hypothetical protein
MRWIQTKNHEDRRHRRDTAALPPQFSTYDCTDNQDNQEEQDVAENENLSLLSDSKKSKGLFDNHFLVLLYIRDVL